MTGVGRSGAKPPIRVPVMLSEADLQGLIYVIRHTPAMERPSRNTVAKLRTALRRVDPDRQSLAWQDLEEL